MDSRSETPGPQLSIRHPRPAQSGSPGFFEKRLPHRVCWIVVVIVLASGVAGGIHRGLKRQPNWGSIQRESSYVWQHKHTAPGTALFGYLPATIFALWPFTTWLPQPVGLLLYVLSNLFAAAGSAWIVARWWLPTGGRAGSIAWPLILVAANFQHTLQANQLTLWTLLLCVAGLTCIASGGKSVGRGRELAGGMLLGLAGLIKVMPLIMIGYMVLRRHWRALIGAALAVVLFDVLPSVAFFGWGGAVAEHRAWLRRAQWHSNRRLIEDPLLRVHRHRSNASYSVVLTRWLRAIPEVSSQVVLYGDPPPDVVDAYRRNLSPHEWLTLDPMPPGDKKWAERRIDLEELHLPRMHLADLSPRTIWCIWAATLTVGLLVLMWATWLSASQRHAGDWAPIAAIWMLAMFWPSPMMRHYYLALAFPAIVVVWRTLVRVRLGGGSLRSAGTMLAMGSQTAWIVGIICLGWDLPRWYGIHLVVLAILTAATAWAWRRTDEQRTAGSPMTGNMAIKTFLIGTLVSASG